MGDKKIMKNAVLFTVADQNNMVHAKKMINSLRKFHSEEEIDIKIFTEKDIGDPINYYRQKPMFAQYLIKKYKVVIGADSDMIFTGNIDYLLNEKYDVATVMNFNRVDSKTYGPISVFDINPTEYMNCGLVAMRDERFIINWWKLCNSAHFNNLQYKEQDLMNVMIHYGDYKVVCLDYPDKIKDYHAWHGLVAKGEYNKMIMRDGKLILPKADDGYPEHDKEIKVLHSAGGKNEKKIGDSYRLYFNEEVIKYIDGLVK